MQKITNRRAILFLATMTLLLNLTACNIFVPINREAVLPAADAFVEEPSPTTSALPVSLPAQVTSQVVEAPEEVESEIDLERRLIQVYEDTNPSVVYIITPLGSGSGFVYDQAGHIVTNNHVVTGASSFEVVFASGERLRARLAGSDTDSDLAVIQVEQLPEEARPIPLAPSDDLQVGQFVIAIGNPFGEQGSMSLGIVSGLGRSLPSRREVTAGSTYSLPQVIQTDAPINPGNSGGPLLNLDGEVVGINSAIATTSGTNLANSGVGFAIPVSAVARIVPSLIESGSYQYPYLGAAFDGEITLAEANQYGLSQTQGAYVISVTAGSPADQAGLLAANSNSGEGGDLIVAIDGQPIQSFADLNSYLVFHATVGDTIEITALRQDRQVTLSLTLGARP